MKIGYLTDPVPEYRAALEAKTLEGLRAGIAPFARVASDAVAIAAAMTEGDFEVWRTGLRKERREQFAGEIFAERYGALLLPLVMLEVSMFADHFKVPWGLAFVRMLEAGRIVEADGICGMAPRE
jgi:hypothetical protein